MRDAYLDKATCKIQLTAAFVKVLAFCEHAAALSVAAGFACHLSTLCPIIVLYVCIKVC